MKDLIHTLIRHLVDRPDDIHISALEGEKIMIYEVHCHPKDVGKIIGKSGKTVGIMRVLLNAIAIRQDRKAILEVVE